MLRSIAGVKSLLHERVQLQIPLEKLKRKVSEKAAAGFLDCVATGASSKLLREHSNTLYIWNGYSRY